MGIIRKINLHNGVRILFERIPYTRSASVGFWIDVGSRNEQDAENGLSHFIEHMFFKGTLRKNAYELSNAMNLIGGNVNAFTSQENICLSAKVIDEHLGHAIGLLAEIYQESAFSEDEIERERNVVLEEVSMYNDTPDELVVDMFMNRLYADHPIGRPILGAPENILRFQRDDIQRFLGREFAPDRIVVAVAGNFDQRRVEPQIRRIFEPISPNGWERNPLTRPAPVYSSHNEDRQLEQVHFCIGTDAPERASGERFGFSILNMIIGGGTSSRIFQEVREKRGLAYSVGSFDCTFKDAGCFAISGGCNPRNIHKVLELCLAEVRKFCGEGVTTGEIENAREQIKSSIVLGMENCSTRMARLAEYEMYFGEYVPVDHVIAKLNAVTRDDVRNLADKYLRDRPVTFTSIGPDKKFERYLNGMTF
ncbi:MAG: pitrilysin family protein [bacterium]|nr:pitrilysin family protein [Candidatus Sumerlaeota bacterium]